MPRRTGNKVRINQGQRGGGLRRNFRCGCGYHFVANCKRDADSIAKRHSRSCEYMRKYLPILLGLQWGSYSHASATTGGRSADGWAPTNVHGFIGAGDDDAPMAPAASAASAPTNSSILDATLREAFRNGYLPGDCVIESRAAASATGSITEPEHEIIRSELQAYFIATRRKFFLFYFIF